MVFRMLLDAYEDPGKRVWIMRFAWAASTGMLILGFSVIAYLFLAR